MKSLEKREVTPAAADEMVRTALETARGKGLEVAVAVVDPHGYLVSFGRTDRADAPVGEYAIDKAYTAGTLGASSAAFGKRMASAPSAGLGLSTRSRLLAWGGGVAIYENGTCIGGLGVSGGADEDDIAIAESAVQAADLDPR